MPYATPSTTTSPPLPTHSLGRPGHRRGYSSDRFTDERGPGAFQSLGTLPRRQSAQNNNNSAPASSSAYNKPSITVNTQKRFHLKPESSSSSSDEDDDDGPPPPLKLKTPLSPSFGVGVPFPRSSPRNSPRSSPLSSPLPADPNLLSPLSGTGLSSLPVNSTVNDKYLAPPQRPSPSRTSSSPILLSNGKPLKSSLKSSSSTSSIPLTHPTPHHTHVHSAHIRARSAPSTPSLLSSTASTPTPESTPPQSTPATPKNVHFPSLSTDLEHIRVFNKSAKPMSFLRRSSDASRGPTGHIPGTSPNLGGEETETETETDREGWVGGYLRSGFGWANGGSQPGLSSAGFPFPKFPSPPQIPGSLPEEWKYVLDLDGYAVPSPQTVRDQYANIIVENMDLGRSTDGKLALEGSLLVRNIAFEKQVYLRFTLDDWATVSEVAAKYESSLTLPSLSSLPGRTLGDIIATSSSLSSSSSSFPHGRSFSESALSDKNRNELIKWDRFTFHINLSDFARLEERKMWCVGRYVVPGRGEWWDNNGGRNFRVQWKREKVQVPVSADKEKEKDQEKDKDKLRERRDGRSLSAPAAPVNVPSVTTTSPSPPAATTTFANASAPAPSTSPTTLNKEALTAATSARLSRFSLKNYVAPGSARSRSGSASSGSGSGSGSPPQTSPTVEKSVSEPAPEPAPSPKKEERDITESTKESAPSSPAVTNNRENRPSFSGIGLYWPWGSSSSSSTAASSKGEDTSAKQGGSPTVAVVPSPKHSPVPVPVPEQLTSPTPKAETQGFFDSVPGLIKDEEGRSSTSGSSESLDSLMSSAFPTSTYRTSISLNELEYGYHPGSFNGLQVGNYNSYDGVGGGVLGVGVGKESNDTSEPMLTTWSPESISPASEAEEAVEADVTEAETETTPTLQPTQRPFSPRPPKPDQVDSDSLYKAFVRQWCFAGVGAGSPTGAVASS
ncbi:carbohydrate-binding module family 21 protein [Moniliophthora roreri]|nr:carbohydrate-binding module family 21 protein [Moniliophthora roreri]